MKYFSFFGNIKIQKKKNEQKYYNKNQFSEELKGKIDLWIKKLCNFCKSCDIERIREKGKEINQIMEIN